MPNQISKNGTGDAGRGTGLEGRQVGKSAIRQVGRSGCRQKNFGSPEVRPPEVRHPKRKFFRLIGGSCSCMAENFSVNWRARLLPSRDFGKSAGRQIGRWADGQSAGRKIGSVWAMSLTVIKLQNSRRPQGATLQKFSAISNFCSLEGEAPAEP